MALSTNMVAGLASGFDWRSMVDQLMAIERRRIDLKGQSQKEYSDKYAEWQSVNNKLLSLKTATEKLKDAADFEQFSTTMSSDSTTVDGEDLLSVTTDSGAAPGSYSIKVTNQAKAQKVSSNPFTSQTADLGASYAGDIIINGRVVAIAASDNLADVASSINNVNSGSDPSGVTASVVNYGNNDYRLVLTSDETGAEGISLLNGSSADLVQQFGWKDKQSAVIKNSITNGAQSDRFSSHSVTVKSLLGLASGEASSGSLTIDGTVVNLDLATQSLTDIKDTINTAMAGAGKGNQIVASVVSETVNGSTYYRLQVEGSQTFVDENNILNTTGVLHHNSADISAANSEVSGNSMTTDGAHVTPDTLLTEIDGYISYDAADNIQLSGTKTGGGAVNSTFNISASTTVQDLLDEIESQYATNSGDAIAYVTSDGKIRVEDVAGGGSLDVTLTDNITNGALEFVNGDAAFGDASAARKREIVAGEDATVEVDGAEVTSSDNTIEDVISGVTLNLLSEETDTTVTLTVEHDIDTVKANIAELVNSYNAVSTYINNQFSYNDAEQKTGGLLFGDGTLRSVKADLVSVMTGTIWGVDADFNALGLVGIENKRDENDAWIMSLDDSKLTSYLKTNFSDVKALFVGQGITSTSTLDYINHGRDTNSGAYTVHVNRAATRGSETGSVNLSAGGADETLTITQSGNTASISITNTMTLADIKNQINAELDAVYAETIVGDQQVNAGGSALSGETKWNAIDGATLQNNDVISFTGTDRSGSSVSGSYTISDVSSDSVQGLLSAMEQEFGSSVTASIDSAGRMVLADKSNGSSQISLDITEPVGRGLDFGTVDVTAGAGDGSQEGRYAMNIIATDDGSNHLVMRSDDYGSTSFSISQDTTDNNYNHILYTDSTNTTSSSSGSVNITATTTWSDVNGAGAVNGDTVTIAGMARDGLTPINGTYTITDTTTDTADGILTAIETAYTAQGTTVDAFIKNGKIYVEDTTAGSSAIALTLTANNEGGGSLSLGTYDQTSKRDLDLGLIDGSYSGQDVAGTIGGEAATGSGQVLTGATDNTNTDGLVVKYSGTSDDTDVGTIDLTLGIAELLERVLYDMTDSVSGYVSFKKDSVQERVDTIDDQIATMEERLDQRMETMMNRFIAMELAMSKMQSQSQWLTGQLGALG